MEDEKLTDDQVDELIEILDVKLGEIERLMIDWLNEEREN